MTTALQEALARKMARRGLVLDPNTNDWVSAEGANAPVASTDAPDASTEANSQPAGDTAPVRDKDWEVEYRRLEQEHNALRGRVAPAQRDADTFRGLYETTAREAEANARKLAEQVNSLQAQLEAATTQRQKQNIQEQIESLLDDEDREAIDPSVLKVIGKVASGLFSQQRVPDPVATVEEVLAKRERQTVDGLRRGLMQDPSRAVSRIVQLSTDSEFMGYLQDHPEVDITINSFLTAAESASVERYAKATDRLLKAYDDSRKAPTLPARASDPSGSQTLRNALERQPGARISEEEVRRLAAEHKMHVRNGNKQKAAAIMQQLDALQN